MKPTAMNAIGMVETMTASGAPVAAYATTRPMTAARLYAGAMLEDARMDKSMSDKVRKSRRTPLCCMAVGLYQ
jgi:hypothetical protein